MRFNISMLQDYVVCPQMAYIRHVLHKGRKGGSLALTEGSMFHLAMEDKLLGRPQRTSLELFSAVDNPRDGAIGEWEKHQLSDVIESWERSEGVVEAVEQELSAEIAPGLIAEGKLDSNLLLDGFRWSEQHKTYTDNLDALCQKVRLSWHEVLYQFLLEENGYKNVAGTVLNACQKLPGYKMVDLTGSGKRTKREVTPEMRRAALTTHYLARDAEEQAEILDTIRRTAIQMQEELENPGGKGGVRKFSPSCFDFNNRCAFYTHCWEGEELVEANGYVQLTPRYKEHNAGAVA